MISDIRKIVNVQYPSKAADLVTAFRNGPICGYTLGPGFTNQSWYVTFVGFNQVQIKNTRTPVYAGVFDELDGIAVSGIAEEYTWDLIYNDNDQFQIATLGGQYVWLLNSEDNNYPIVLRSVESAEGANTYWEFQVADDTPA